MSGIPSSRSGGQPEGGIARGLQSLRQVVDELRPYGDRHEQRRPERDGVRDDVLLVLAEQPANGYRVVQLLQQRGVGGATAGAVYPALQLLADEGLVDAADDDGRRTWSLTSAGRAAAEAAALRPVDEAATRAPGRRAGIVRSGAQLAQTAALAAQTASPDEAGEIVAVLDDARRRVLRILARG